MAQHLGPEVTVPATSSLCWGLVTRPHQAARWGVGFCFLIALQRGRAARVSGGQLAASATLPQVFF